MQASTALPSAAECQICTMDDLVLSSNTQSGFKGVYPNGDAWQVKCRVNGKMECLGTYDCAQEAALARLRHFCTHATVSKKRTAQKLLTPLPICDHTLMGSEEGSLSAELTAASQYRAPFSPLRRDKLHQLQGSAFSVTGLYRLRQTRGLVAAEQSAGGINAGRR